LPGRVRLNKVSFVRRAQKKLACRLHIAHAQLLQESPPANLMWLVTKYEASLHVSRRRLLIPHNRETNQLAWKAFGDCRTGTVCTYSLSGKMCRHSLNDRHLGRKLAQ
jgi:hypothetical protein